MMQAKEEPESKGCESSDYESTSSGAESDEGEECKASGKEEAELRTRAKSIGRRNTVMAPAMEVDLEWSPPSYVKTVDEIESIQESLKNNMLFATLDEDAMSITINAMRRFRMSEGETIITQSEEGDEFYMLEEGQCTICVDGKEVMKIKGGGARNYFGELALLHGAPRAATVTTTTDVVGWMLDRATFKKILMNATIAKRMLYKQFLNEVPIFDTLSRFDRLTLADALQSVVFPAQTVILEEGEKGNEFFIIEEGHVKCTNGGKEVSKALGRGDYFGELSLLNDDVRKATVTTTEETKVLMMDRGTFKRLLGPLEGHLRQNVELYDKYVNQCK